jgi:hypothetical protein
VPVLNGAIYLRDHFLPPVEENHVRNQKFFFVLGTDRIYDCEHTTTFIFEIGCSSQILYKYGIDDFALLHFLQTSNILAKTGYLPNGEKLGKTPSRQICPILMCR